MSELDLTGFTEGEPIEVHISDGVNSDILLLPAGWGNSVALAGDTSVTVPVNMEGRVTRIVPPAQNVDSVTVVSQPTYGRVTVNDDLSLSWNLMTYRGTAADQFEYSYTTTSDPTPVIVTYEVPAILQSPQEGHWPDGYVYYFETGPDLLSRIEPGKNHRKYHIATDGLTKADIVAREPDLSDVSDVTNQWLTETLADGTSSHYGETPELALHPDVGMPLWTIMHPQQSSGTSDWLLFKRGQIFSDLGRIFERGVQGESAMHPLVVDAFGTGPAPILQSGPIADGQYSRYLVLRGIRLEYARFVLRGGGGDGSGGHFLVEHVDQFGGHESAMEDGMRMACRFVRHINQVDTKPFGINGYPFWNESQDRISGFFTDKVSGMLIENGMVYHSGWGEGYSPFSHNTSPQPPSAKSQGYYLQKRGLGFIVRKPIAARASATGMQLRCGGIVQDGLFTDSNQLGFTGKGQERNDAPTYEGSWSYWYGNVGTHAGYREVWEPRTNFLANPGPETDPVDGSAWKLVTGNPCRPIAGQNADFKLWRSNIVCHKADPDDPEDITFKVKNSNFNPGPNAIFDDTRVYRWGADQNLGGLDPSLLDQTTLQRYAAAHPGFSGSTIDDWCQYYTTLETPIEQVDEQRAVINYFRSNFGVALMDGRTTPQTILFSCNPLADGTQWFTPINWSTEDTPINGDSVDLQGCWTICSCLTVTLDGLALGNGGKVKLINGALTHTGPLTCGPEGGILEIDYIGRLTTSGYAGSEPLRVIQTGGRFVNTGSFTGAADIHIEDGQFITATGAQTTISAGRRLTLLGARPEVGFDSTDGGTATLSFEVGSTLHFIADASSLATIQPFHSGRFGTDPVNVTSVVDLNGTLSIDVTGLEVGTYRLINVSVLTGTFDAVSVLGQENETDVTVTVNIGTGQVDLLLASGTGQVMLTTL